MISLRLNHSSRCPCCFFCYLSSPSSLETTRLQERIAKQVEQQSQGKNEVGRRNEDAPEGKNVDTDSGASSSDAENDDNSSSDEDRRQVSQKRMCVGGVAEDSGLKRRPQMKRQRTKLQRN